MGTSTPQAILNHYTSQVHSIQGQVDVYKINSEPIFVFFRRENSVANAKLFHSIGKEEGSTLCTYYGNLSQNINISMSFDCTKCGQDISMFGLWPFYNYTLGHEIIKNRETRRLPTQKRVWQLLKALCTASITLKKFEVFMDFTFENVQISPLKRFIVYWAQIKANNSHKKYLQSFFSKQMQQFLYSPEQLSSIIREKPSLKYSYEKSTIFSMAMLVYCFINQTNSYQPFYDFQNKAIRQQNLNKCRANALKRYSLKLNNLLMAMTEENCQHRITLASLNDIINDKNKDDNEKIDHERDDTAESSKISVKIGQ